MNMKIIKKEKCLCTCCMEEHEVKTVLVDEKTEYKGITLEYEACYNYCENAYELFMNEQQLQENDMAIKNAYRRAVGLLTTEEIKNIRDDYGISQSDLCLVLGWGGKTITRYEGHQIQDKAHDTILRKIDSDPEWFMVLLENAKECVSVDAYNRYIKYATLLYESKQDSYLRKSIEASYAKYSANEDARGNAKLSLDKVIEVIRYFASSENVTNLYKVKLMKLLWYTDALSYKLRGHAITGLVYQALPMGAVPIAHDSIISLKGIPCEEEELGEISAYHFVLSKRPKFSFLTKEDKAILDKVIKHFGQMTKDDIVSYMHKETAYSKTKPKGIIEFKYAKDLSI